MANYVQEKGIDIGYELWSKGYRVNTRLFSKKDFADRLNRLNEEHDYEVTFDMLFEAILLLNPEWLIDEAAEEEAYRLENEPKLRQYFLDNFLGKTWQEIEGDEALYDKWGFYSDWHKDVYGYRPHGIVCGVYINPYVDDWRR